LGLFLYYPQYTKARPDRQAGFSHRPGIVRILSADISCRAELFGTTFGAVFKQSEKMFQGGPRSFERLKQLLIGLGIGLSALKNQIAA
jgi:hypothetical protein